jgi:hypothetical protein
LRRRRVPEAGNSANNKNLVIEETEYIHSSAKYYETGEGRYKITNYTELEDIDLTKAL